jgi:hypothetical protein
LARSAPSAPSASPASAAPELTLDAPADGRYAGDFIVGGMARGAAGLRLVVDGDVASARSVTPGADGRWQATVDTGRMVDPGTRHSLTAWAEGQATSETRSFTVQRDWRVVADVPDPAGDDHGPDGRYLYPTDSGWGANRQMDLERVRVATSGGALRVELTLKQITTLWNPPNGFDHVAFTLFIELPGRSGGATVMPLQNANLPAGMRWHLRIRAGGWSNALFSAEGASTNHEGSAVTPAAGIQVDRAAGTVSFALPAAALGGAASLSGARIYVTTWDYDGGFRALGPVPQAYALGGGPADGAKVMDDSAVIVLP